MSDIKYKNCLRCNIVFKSNTESSAVSQYCVLCLEYKALQSELAKAREENERLRKRVGELPTSVMIRNVEVIIKDHEDGIGGIVKND